MEKPLFWHQGLFLQPQHFQIKDLYDQSLLAPYQRFLNPHFWGLGEMSVRREALGDYSFDLARGEFLFPDMTYAVFPENALLQPRSFEGAWPEGGKELPVWVGIRKWNAAGENVTVVSSILNIKNVNTRFATATDGEEIGDLHHNGPPAEVKRMYHVLKIFWGPEKDKLGDYELIQVAALEKEGDRIVLSDRFIPPCIGLSGSEVLGRRVREIRDQIASRGRQLEAYKRERGIHSADFGSRDMAYFLALRTLNRYIPLLSHFTETDHIHPWMVYGVLRQLAGELSAFSSRFSATGEGEDSKLLLPAYDHRQIGECMATAQELVARLLDEITAGPEHVISLMYDGTYYSADLAPSLFEGRNRYFLVFETESDPKKIIEDALHIAKLGTRELLPLLIARALPGIPLKHQSLPPQELPRRSHSLYFQIDHNNDHWTQVMREKNLALYWDTAPPDLKVELMAAGRS